MSDEIISISQLMMRVANISMSENENSIYSVWKKVVSKIQNNEMENGEKRIPLGERLAGNTRAVEIKRGVLLVETDHAGWIQYLKIYQKFILTGINRALPDLKIHSLAFRIKGVQVGLNSNYEEEVIKARRKISEELNKQDEEIEKFYAENGNFDKNSENSSKSGGSNLPPEILEKFESIKRSMLTNSEK